MKTIKEIKKMGLQILGVASYIPNIPYAALTNDGSFEISKETYILIATGIDKELSEDE